MIPAFTVLTGYLGAGKTTALNRLLGALPHRRVAVLVNELGRIAIDGRLILSRGGDVLELAGGCVCCKIDVKNDLWDGIADVIARSAPDHVVLETTGIAEPDAILQGAGRLPEDRRVAPAGVVCVVDAEAAAAQLDARDEARIQVEAADRLLLSKLDVAPPASAARVHRRLRALNPAAEIASFPAGDDGDRALACWLLEARALSPAASSAASAASGAASGASPGPGGGRAPHRHGQLVAASFRDPAPLLAEPLMALIDELSDRLVRAKGFVHVAGEPRRGFLERAGARTSLSWGEPWGDQPPCTELVLIGELDEAAVRRKLWACRTIRQ